MDTLKKLLKKIKNNTLSRYIKGIFCGLGGVSPGLSGSVMLVIFGLYHKTIHSISTFFKKPKESLKFLLPLFLGIGTGVLIFGKIVSRLLFYFEMQTRLTFLGFVLGTIPLFYRQVKDKDFNKKHYFVIGLGLIIGLSILIYNKGFMQVEETNFIKSMMLGLILAASTIIPGVDSAVVLSSFGLYEIFINAVDKIDLTILIPVLIGGGAGILIFSTLIDYLMKKHYTITYALIFGLFLSIIPSVINSSVQFSLNLKTFVSIILFISGTIVSYKLSKIEVKN